MCVFTERPGGEPESDFARLSSRVAAGSTGVYALSGGSINYSSGGFNIGELGTGILNLSGGSITGTGNLAINVGTGIVPNAVTASMDGGTNKTGFTWFEQDYTQLIPRLVCPRLVLLHQHGTAGSFLYDGFQLHSQ